MRAGLVPITIFCHVFMFATAIELGVVELGRMIVGPQDMLFNEVTASYILIVARCLPHCRRLLDCLGARFLLAPHLLPRRGGSRR